ncbi:MAG: 2-hydroxyglutaryl-CoA dehydratase [Deltaproteobacteria bacterium]|nr:2-hydroxyglutaryl-CoA dehydratase [Deltaproteobacteria bacterium]
MAKSVNALNISTKINKYASPLTMGVDSGSLTAKAVIMDGKKEIIADSVVQLDYVSQKAVELAIGNVFESTGLCRENITYTVGTGYGRRKLDFADKAITEITCHARGANYVYPEGRMVIDIGGQDSKVIALDEKGNVINFAMNDKCAAGTGQFLEVMARALGFELEQIGELSLKAQKDIEISSMCVVFAETEIISLIAQGEDKYDVLGAIHNSIARRVAGMIGRVGLVKPVIMTGGVAKNIGMVRALEKVMNISIHVPKDPQIIGAIGAALFAQDYASN